jgi:hypothetical protein
LLQNAGILGAAVSAFNIILSLCLLALIIKIGIVLLGIAVPRSVSIQAV